MRQAIIVSGLGYGDEGKGHIVDALARHYNPALVVRHNGGPQASHNVITDDGRHHAFHQFGSGTLAGAATHLSRHMLIAPTYLAAEADDLALIGVPNAMDRLTIEQDAPLLTPWHTAVNMLREILRGDARHGSCGMGVGEATEDYLSCSEADIPTVGDAISLSHTMLRDKLQAVRDRMWQTYTHLLKDVQRRQREGEKMPGMLPAMMLMGKPGMVDDLVEDYKVILSKVGVVSRDYLPEMMRNDFTVIFEGAQGTLLDRWHGFYPYNSWTDTTYAGADDLLAGYDGQIVRLGVMRSYATRHGRGPFPTEMEDVNHDEPHNGTGMWQGAFRQGYLDLVMLRYALDVMGTTDGMVITHMDKWSGDVRYPVAVGYRCTDESLRFIMQYFHLADDGRTITGIKVNPDPHDTIYQQELTELLMKCEPIYKDYEGNAQQLMTLIEESSGCIPLQAVSYGPKPSDVIFRHINPS